MRIDRLRGSSAVWCVPWGMGKVLARHCGARAAPRQNWTRSLRLSAPGGYGIGCWVGESREASACRPTRADAAFRGSADVRLTSGSVTQCGRGPRPSDPGSAGDQRDHRADQEHDEQNLGDTRSASGDAAESQHAGDDRDDEKYNCVVKHKTLDLRIADVARLLGEKYRQAAIRVGSGAVSNCCRIPATAAL